MPPATITFLKNLLRTIRESDADPKVVYPFLQAHLDQLTDKLLQHLQTWAIETFSTLDPEQQRRTAKNIANFSLLVRGFPLGDKATNVEIAIAGYEIAIQIFTRTAFPEDWASIQNNLGVAYCERILDERSKNVELAIACFEKVLQIRTCETLPEGWANTHNNLGIAYKFRILGPRQQNLKTAIVSHKKALQIQTLIETPEAWATSHMNMGNAYSEWIWKPRLRYQERAIWHYQQALQVYAFT